MSALSLDSPALLLRILHGIVAFFLMGCTDRAEWVGCAPMRIIDEHGVCMLRNKQK